MRPPVARGLALAAALAFAAPLPAAPPLPNSYSDRLARLPDLQRKAALRSAILDNSVYCKRVETAAVRGPWKNLVMWRVGCDKGATYGVFIGPDGSVQVRPCADLPKLKLPRC